MPDPQTYRRDFLFKGKTSLLKKPLHCEGRSEWVDFTRDLKKTAEGVRFTEELTLKKSVISAAAMRSVEFAQIQDQIQSCLQQAVIVFE